MARPAKTSRENILQAALSLVDEHGIAALSMRRLGDRLGVEAMSLYRHVPNKEAVLDGVHEAVLRDMRRPQLKGTWLEDVRALARAFRKALRAHPNAVPLFASRPAISQGSLDYVELALAALAEPFPDIRVRIQAFQTIAAFVIGHAMLHFSPSGSGTSTGPDYKNLPPERFPILSGVAPAMARYSADTEFKLGLDALLRGLQAQAKAPGRGTG